MKKLLLGVALTLAAMAAGAQDRGFYVGGHLGQAKAKDACSDVGGPGISCDDTATSFKILGGYQFNKHLAAELGYIDFGKAEARGPGGTITLKSHAFDLVAVGTLPIADRFSVYGKIGAYRATTDLNVSTTLLRGSASDDSTDLTYGVGAGFDATRQVTLRAEWQRYSDVGGDNVGGKGDVDVISLGVLFRF
jgi:OOP family OmpA-OmpF porin